MLDFLSEEVKGMKEVKKLKTKHLIPKTVHYSLFVVYWKSTDSFGFR